MTPAEMVNVSAAEGVMIRLTPQGGISLKGDSGGSQPMVGCPEIAKVRLDCLPDHRKDRHGLARPNRGG